MNGSNVSLFTKFAKTTSAAAGRAATFIMALVLIVVWAVSGPIFKFSDTWQLVINTGTTIITFLMVFLIQNTQNRDTLAIQLKLDELINSIKEARNEIMDLEELDEKDLEEKRKEMVGLAQDAKNGRNRSGEDEDHGAGS